MTCQEWERLLANEDPAAETVEHLSVCPHCRALANEMQANAAALRSMRDEILPAIALRPSSPRRWIPAIAAALLILTLVTVRVSPLLEPVPPPPAAAVRAPAPPPVPPIRAATVRERSIARTGRPRPPQTLMVKMLTPDPDIVIYWLIEPNQGELQ